MTARPDLNLANNSPPQAHSHRYLTNVSESQVSALGPVALLLLNLTTQPLFVYVSFIQAV